MLKDSLGLPSSARESSFHHWMLPPLLVLHLMVNSEDVDNCIFKYRISNTAYFIYAYVQFISFSAFCRRKTQSTTTTHYQSMAKLRDMDRTIVRTTLLMFW